MESVATVGLQGQPDEEEKGVQAALSFRKKVFIGGGVALLAAFTLGILFLVIFSKRGTEIIIGVNAKNVTLACSSDYMIEGTYYAPNNEGTMQKVTLGLISKDGRIDYQMSRASEVNGDFFETQDKNYSFASVDKTFIFSEKGKTLALCEEGEVDTFILDGARVDLVNGVYEKEVGGTSIVKEKVVYFGNEVLGDIDGDTKDDKAFLVTKETGGSGVFFYVVGILDYRGEKTGLKALFLGDRIAPQSLRIDNGKLHVFYADRKEGEPMTSAPSQAKHLIVSVVREFNELAQVVDDFEGEASDEMMTITMKEWKWQKTVYEDGSQVVPQKKDVFSATFNKDSSVSFGTDCNTMNATYVQGTSSLSITSIISTKMFCEGSQEIEYARMLSEAQSYLLTGRGELILILSGGGNMVFR